VAGIEKGEGRQFDDLLANVDNDVTTSAAATSETVRTGAGSTGSATNVDASSVTNQTNSNSNTTTTSNTQIPLTPFAIIDEVSPSSPASTAGIELNDLLLQFDTIDHTNHDNFSAIARLLPTKEGKAINVKVRRCKTMEWGEVHEVLDLELMPRKWSGRGLLGCHISKYDEE
jgi:S1-C subfamily serine protease